MVRSLPIPLTKMADLDERTDREAEELARQGKLPRSTQKPQEDIGSKIEDAPKKSFLEKAVNFAMKPISYALPVAATAAGAYAAGLIPTLIMNAGMVAGHIATNKGKWTWKQLRDTWSASSIMSGALNYMFMPMNALPKTLWGYVARSAYGFFGVMPAFNVMYSNMLSWLKKYNPYNFIKGMFKGEPIKDIVRMPKEYMKEQWGKDTQSAYKAIWPYVLAQWNVLPPALQVPAAGPINYLYSKSLLRSQEKAKYK